MSVIAKKLSWFLTFVDSCSSLAYALAGLLIAALGALTVALLGVAITASDAGDRRGFGCGAAFAAILLIVALLGSLAAGAVNATGGCS